MAVSEGPPQMRASRCTTSNALKLGFFGANCSSGLAATKAPGPLVGIVGGQPAVGPADGRRRDRLHAADRALARLRRRDELRTRDARDADVGLRPARADAAPHRLRHGARTAGPSGVRREADGDGRSHRSRPLRAQRRVRLERRRVRHVRRRAARARHALQIRRGMAARSCGAVGRTRRRSIRRRVLHAAGRVRRAEAVRRHAADRHERRLLAGRRARSPRATPTSCSSRFAGSSKRASRSVRRSPRAPRSRGRSVGVFTSASVVCRPTQREADDFFRYYAEEQGDWGASTT